MTDQEIICTFMEPKPPVADQQEAETMDLCGSGLRSPLGFWRCIGGYDEPYLWQPHCSTLDALWEVEERLTIGQWIVYGSKLSEVQPGLGYPGGMIHATAEQKIKALAAVLRPIAEGR